MGILAENEVSDSGEDTVGADSEDAVSFSGRETQNPVASEFKAGAHAVYLGQGGDEMRLEYIVPVHRDREGGRLSIQWIWKDLVKNRLKDNIFSLLLLKRSLYPPVPVPVPSHSSSKISQAKKDRHAKKEYLKQMSELAKIVQHQCLENNKLEKLFSDSKRKPLQLSLALSRQQESDHADPWDKFVAAEVTGSYYDVAIGKGFGSLGIYVDVNKFLLEASGVVGSLFKVCESYSEAHLYLREHVAKEKEDPTFLGTDLIGSPPSPPGRVSSPPEPHLGGCNVMEDQSKGKEVEICG
jgi:hypothetical protein